jgi:hypothetical protein
MSDKDDAEPTKPFSVSVEGAENGSADLTSITLQGNDPGDAERAKEARERMERPVSDQTKNEMDVGAKQIGQEKGQPALSRVQAEIEAGRAKVAEHAARQSLLDAKRSSTKPEGEQVTAATETNKDL